MPAAWFEDDRMLITIADVLRVQAEQIDKATKKQQTRGTAAGGGRSRGR